MHLQWQARVALLPWWSFCIHGIYDIGGISNESLEQGDAFQPS